MSYSNTISSATTFTLTHAKYLASKVATDLARIQRFYDLPTNSQIQAYEAELTEFLKAGYLQTVTYGFKRDGNFIEPTLRYTARELMDGSSADDDPGKIRPGANVLGATFGSYMTYSDAWNKLTSAGQEHFKSRLPFTRSGAPEPTLSGYLAGDRDYSSGGRALNRQSLRSFS